MPRFAIKGYEIETRTPTLANLTAVRQSRGITQDYGAARDLVKAVCPRFSELVQKRASSVQGLAIQVLQAAGVGGTVRVLDEAEISDADMAGAFAAKTLEFERLFPDPEDERRVLLPLLIMTEIGEERAFIVRYPFEREVEAFRKANTAEAAKLLCKKIAVWGDVDGLEHDLPGMYLTMAEFVLDASGDFEAVRVGEA